MYIKLFVVIVISFFSVLQTISQNVVLFVGGDSLLAERITLLDSTKEISLQLYQSKHTRIVNRDEIFSITSPSGKETILFTPFQEDNLNFSVQNMRYFIKGEQYSDKHSAWFAGALGLGIGFASPIIMSNKFNPFYSPLPVAFATALIGYTSPSEKRIKKLYPELADNIYFLEGYKLNGKARRINSSLRGGLIGFVAGWITTIVLYKQQPHNTP